MSLEHQSVEEQVPSEHWTDARQMLEPPQEPSQFKPINRVAILMVALLIVVVAVGNALEMSI